MPTLTLDAVSLIYTGRRGPVTALDTLSLTIRDGECVVVLGPSGCGKSSLLGLLAGFQRPSRGRVLRDGQPITGAGPDRAVVFQDDALFPWLDVLANVAFGLRVQGLDRAEREERARAVLARVGLAGFEHHAMHELSGGMRQRVGLARALAADPAFLLMDEPLGALDALTREQMQTLLLDVWRATEPGQPDKGLFVITHSIEEALLLATRLVLLSPRPGRIVEELAPPFARRYADGEPARALKLDREFLSLREHVLSRVLDHQDTSARHEEPSHVSP